MNATTKDSINIIDVFVNTLDDSPEFNCRGKITPLDVRGLVDSIVENGLHVPIVVHNYNNEEKEKTNKGYRVISGYRRLFAVKSLGWATIPCIVKEWMPEDKARVLNLIENLQREDLNILQEAKSIANLKYAGYTMADVAKALNKSTSWVQTRFNVLDFPADIQDDCAKGFLNQNQIKDVYSLPLEKQFEAVKKIKEQRERGDKNITVKKSVTANAKKARNKNEINKMIDYLMDNLGPSFGTRVAAWCAGNISTLDLFTDVKSQLAIKGKEFILPEEDF